MPEETIMAYHGESVLDSGYFFIPYVPLLETPPILTMEALSQHLSVLEEVDWVNEGF